MMASAKNMSLILNMLCLKSSLGSGKQELHNPNPE